MQMTWPPKPMQTRRQKCSKKWSWTDVGISTTCLTKTILTNFLNQRRGTMLSNSFPMQVPTLTARSTPLNCNEQEELNKFLDENLSSGRIRPSKSPMASPFFFIQKKDRKLWPVQDYHKLNEMIIKNHYLLPPHLGANGQIARCQVLF